MGYRPKSVVYALDFEDGDHAGLEVCARGVALGTFLDLTSLASSAGESLGDTSLTPQQAKASVDAIGKLLAGFADVLVSWNVEHPTTGEPLPPTLDGLRSLDFPFVFVMIKAWMGAAAGVSAPLGQPSSGGRQSAEASIPMVPRSVSQAS